MLDILRFPSVKLCRRPTPLGPMVRVGEYMGGPNFWIKHNDRTVLAIGGNKTLEARIPDACCLGGECGSGRHPDAVQSNHVRQTAAVAAHCGLDCHSLPEWHMPPTARRHPFRSCLFRQGGSQACSGFFDSDDNVVFLHMGGSAALFAMRTVPSHAGTEAFSPPGRLE